MFMVDSLCKLAEIPSGTRARVVSLDGGPQSRGRLCAMGLVPGTEFIVCENSGGPCNLRVRNCGLVLGQGMAKKIVCERLS